MRKCSYFRANECIFALLVAVSRKSLRISRNEQQKVSLEDYKVVSYWEYWDFFFCVPVSQIEK